MPFMTRIPSDLARFGLRVELVPGWETRGSSSFAPACVVDHWTAGPRGTTKRPSLNVVTYGRTDLPGPLCNIYLARDGTCVVVAAGRANHAGTGGWRGLVGNSAAYGIEAESAGDGDWTPAMLDAYPRLNAALLSGLGRDGSWVCGHNEWAPGRKIDIRDVIASVRAKTAAVLSGTAPTVQEDDMPLSDDDIDRIWRHPLPDDNGVPILRLMDIQRQLTEPIASRVPGADPNIRFHPRDLLALIDANVFSLVAAALNGKTADVDEQQLAAALAPLLMRSAQSLTQADLDAVAKAVADEQARRQSA